MELAFISDKGYNQIRQLPLASSLPSLYAFKKARAVTAKFISDRNNIDSGRISQIIAIQLDDPEDTPPTEPIVTHRITNKRRHSVMAEERERSVSVQRRMQRRLTAIMPPVSSMLYWRMPFLRLSLKAQSSVRQVRRIRSSLKCVFLQMALNSLVE